MKSTTKSGGEIWEHNCESLKKLWEEVAKEMGEKSQVKPWLWRFGIHSGLTWEGQGGTEWFRGKGHGIVTFIATRVQVL